MNTIQNAKLRKVLSETEAKQRTGNLYVLGRKASDRPLQVHFRVAYGEIVAMRPLIRRDRITEDEVLAANITQIIFNNSSHVSPNEQKVHQITIETLLQKLNQKPQARSMMQQRVTPRGSLLAREAAVLLKQVYGQSAAQHVSQISRRVSPEDAPLEFLAACQTLMSTRLGTANAAQMFTSLRSRYR